MNAEPAHPSDAASPGWYPDPWRNASLRWWDGASWTKEVSVPDEVLIDVVEFTGGMNVPSQLGGRLNTTVPGIRLTISSDTLRMHGRFFSAIFTDFEVPLRAITAAFRLKGTFMTSGVGFELSDGELAYFWTLRAQAPILAALEQRGVPVDPEPRRARRAVSGQIGILLNPGRPTAASSVAKLPGYSKMALRLMPLLLAFGVAMVVIFAFSGTSFGWFVAALGALGVVRSVLVLRRHRSP